MRTIIAFTFTCILILSTQAWAQTQHTSGYWAGLFGRSELSDTVSFHQEAQLRKNTETGLTTQSIFRAGPIWKLSDTQDIGLLYAFVKTGLLTEHRLTEQFTYRYNDTLSSRFRLEQRTLEKENGISLRLRLNLRYQKPITDRHALVLWNEYFYQATRPDWIYDAEFDRNRYFLGARSTFEKITLEYGYMNQYANRAGHDLNEHLFLIYLIL